MLIKDFNLPRTSFGSCTTLCYLFVFLNYQLFFYAHEGCRGGGPTHIVLLSVLIINPCSLSLSQWTALERTLLCEFPEKKTPTQFLDLGDFSPREKRRLSFALLLHFVQLLDVSIVILLWCFVCGLWLSLWFCLFNLSCSLSCELNLSICFVQSVYSVCFVYYICFVCFPCVVWSLVWSVHLSVVIRIVCFDLSVTFYPLSPPLLISLLVLGTSGMGPNHAWGIGRIISFLPDLRESKASTLVPSFFSPLNPLSPIINFGLT